MPDVFVWIIWIIAIALAVFHIVVMWTVYLAANDARDYFQRRRAEDQRRTREQYAARKSA